MGLTFTVLQKLGLPGVQSLYTDKVFDTFFQGEMNTFPEFHVAFINLCNAFNTVMPGKHVKAPPKDEIKDYYEKWKKIKDDPLKKDKLKDTLTELMEKHVRETRSKGDSLIVVTGMVAPAASMVLKKQGESIPQLKRFRLNLIPDVLFVPSLTILALMAAKMSQIKGMNDVNVRKA